MSVCASQNCQVRSNIILPFVCCYLCDNIYHAKCAGFSNAANTANAISDALKSSELSLYWLCKNCKNPKNNIFLAMTKINTTFKEMEVKLQACNLVIMKFNAAFKDCKFMQDDNVSTDSQNAVSPQSVNMDFNSFISTSPLSSSFSKNNSVTMPPLATPIQSSSAKKTHLSSNSTTPNLLRSSANPKPSSLNQKASICENSAASNAPQITIGEADKSISDSSSTLLYSSLPLTVVPQPKSIFVSRFGSSTTENEVLSYIKSKKNQKYESLDIKVFKLKNKTERNFSSFKISPPMEVYVDIVEPQFWPEGMIVHEFIRRPKKPISRTLNPTATSDQRSSKN